MEEPQTRDVRLDEPERRASDEARIDDSNWRSVLLPVIAGSGVVLRFLEMLMVYVIMEEHIF